MTKIIDLGSHLLPIMMKSADASPMELLGATNRETSLLRNMAHNYNVRRRVERILTRKWREGDKLSKDQFFAFVYGSSIQRLRRMAINQQD